MTKFRFLFGWILWIAVFALLNPVQSSGTSLIYESGLHNSSVIKPSTKKLSFGKRLLYKIAVALKLKRSSKTLVIVLAVLGIVFVGFIAFAAAFGGASGAAVALILVLGLGLIVFALVKMAKKRKGLSS